MESFFDNIDLSAIAPQTEQKKNIPDKKINSMLDEMLNETQTDVNVMQDDMFMDTVPEREESAKEEKRPLREDKKKKAEMQSKSSVNTTRDDDNGLCITDGYVLIKSGCCIDGNILMENCKQSLMVHGSVNGDVSARCVEIMGKVTGNIHADDIIIHKDGKLKSDDSNINVKNGFSLAKGGKVTGNIICMDASISGQVKGSISASGHLSISEGAVITGSIKASSIVIDEAVSAGSVILLKSADSHMNEDDGE